MRWEPGAVRDALHDAVRALSGVAPEARSLDAAARRDLLADVDRATAVLATTRAALVLAEREAGAWRGTGAPSFAAWRGRQTREGARGGATEERRAEVLGGTPGLPEAAADGRVSLAHVDVIGRAAGTASAAVRTALASPEGQRRVLDMAQRLDAGRFGTAMAQWAASVDAAAAERGHQSQRAARFLHLTDAADGTHIKGRLDRMAGHRLRLALEALSPRPAADDERTSEQRRADALDTMAEKILALPETVPGAAQRPHVSFLMTEATWAALRAERQAGSGTGPGSGETAGRGAPVVPPVTLEDGTPVPTSEVARALCDCELTRIVLDSASEPLDLGRSTRTYSGVQRRAVIARDAGCAWEGCAMAPRWLEVHHSRWWDRDEAETSVANGVAVCSFHHHEIHRQDLAIRRLALRGDELAVAAPRRVRYLLTGRDGRVVAGSPPEGALPAGSPPAGSPPAGSPPAEPPPPAGPPLTAEPPPAGPPPRPGEGPEMDELTLDVAV